MSLAITDVTVCLRNHHVLSHGVKTQSLWWQQRKSTQASVDTQQNQASQSITSFSHHHNTATKSSNGEICCSVSETRYKYAWSKKTKLNNAGQSDTKKLYLLSNLHSKEHLSWKRNEEAIWDLYLQHLKSKIMQELFPDRCYTDKGSKIPTFLWPTELFIHLDQFSVHCRVLYISAVEMSAFPLI